jgi:microcystin-dependent protein
MPGTPIPNYAQVPETLAQMQQQLAALANQQQFTITDPTGASGDPANNNAVAVIGSLTGYGTLTGYGEAVWVGPPKGGGWQQIGGPGGGSAIFQPGDVFPSYAATRAGALICDGTAYTGGTTTYPALATACPGLVSGTTLTVPDLRGRTVIGSDSGGVHMPVNKPALGAAIGEEEHVLALAELTAHNHGGSTGTGTTGTGSTGSANTSTEGSYHTHSASGNILVTGAGGVYLGSSGTLEAGSVTATGDQSTLHVHSAGPLSVPGLSVPALSIASAGSSDAHNTVMPSVALNFFIKT